MRELPEGRELKLEARGESAASRRRRFFVYIAYLDDSGSGDGEEKSAFQVIAAVIVPDSKFMDLEIALAVTIADLFADGAEHKFQEFHAAELFSGSGTFENIPQPQRYEAIQKCLDTVRELKFPIIYGAVDKAKLQQKLYASAKPLDMAFRLCVQGIEKWMTENATGQDSLCMIIADDTENKKVKQDLKDAFRHFRKHMRPPDFSWGEGAHIHDEMYFGDSKDSIGIQVADMCTFFVFQHLKGGTASKPFYDIFSGQIYYGIVEPV